MSSFMDNMLSSDNIISVIIPGIAAIFTFMNFLFSYRKKKVHKLADESLKENISPMYRDLIEIWIIRSKKNKNNFSHFYTLREEFIIKYSNEEKLYKVRDFNIINRLLQLKLNVNKINEYELERPFIELSRLIEKEYWRLIMLSSEKYIWDKNRINFPYWLKITLSFCAGAYKFFYYCLVVLAWTFVLSFYMVLTSDLEIKNFVLNVFFILLFVLILFGAFKGINSVITESTYSIQPKKDSLPVRKLTKEYYQKELIKNQKSKIINKIILYINEKI